MEQSPRKGALWLAVCSGLLLLPKALSEASVGISGWSEDPWVSLWFLFSLAFTLLIFLGAWALRTTSRPRIWGWVILVSAFSQPLVGWTLYGYVLEDWMPSPLLRYVAAPALTFVGMLCGVISGILLIVEQKRGSDTPT